MRLSLKEVPAMEIPTTDAIAAARRRPAMYIPGCGGRGLRHIIDEVIEDCLNAPGSRVDQLVIGASTPMQTGCAVTWRRSSTMNAGLPLQVRAATEKS